ncbi:hypothetical protein ACFPES_15070 [Paenibacillus sp. GCM10023248]|uniref:hypothetical protein n=1 Tax=Bacillales TaxID=1385 RepID=UPI002379C368|nr:MULTISPECIES: hypothetical protein [Bacillales]MDD9268360.1 hypothetical protein [Paenibacillus sp. MAHUQ-63]MDR6879249.1 uncharacterized membrane protein YvlD (DUF360 family) [Bacillus sp. 3255]
MRVIVAYATIFITSLSYLVITDVVTGMKLGEAIDVLRESFYVGTTLEYWAFVILILVPVLAAIFKPLQSLLRSKFPPSHKSK